MVNVKLKAVSLFANVGIAETYLEKIGIDVVLANELEPQRVKFYNHLYPKTKVINGDIKNKKIKEEIIKESKKLGVELLMATPPCQGMSSAGKNDKNDYRNSLICDAVDIIKEIKPKYVFIENVPQQLNTKINYKNQLISIPEYLKKELGNNYSFNNNFLINTSNYGVPQTRKRAIILLVKKELDFSWNFPKKEVKKITLKDSIGNLPQLDPEITGFSKEEILKIFPNFYENKERALKISKWFYPPKHVFRQIYSLMHTPSGKTAFDNEEKYKPRKSDGSLAKGFKSTYKRQCWNKPAFTVTMYNRTISSQNNVHPGRFIEMDKKGDKIYSDARVLTIYELMIVSSLPKDWDIPNWASEHFIRQVIGEGIPPLLVKKIMKELVNNLEK